MNIFKEFVSSFSDKGVRKNNEDQYGVYASEDGNAMLLVLADGMGGHSCGEVASEWAVNILIKMFEKHQFGDSGKLLEDAIVSAHERIFLEASKDDRKYGMGTTIVAAVLRPGEVLISHVGDSRALQFRDIYVKRLTRDHLYAIDVLECDEAQAKSHPQGNVLSQALGIDGSIKPSLNSFTTETGDYILLCSDGVSEHVPEPLMASIIREQPFDLAAQTIAKRAIENGSKDNCTVVLARMP